LVRFLNINVQYGALLIFLMGNKFNKT